MTDMTWNARAEAKRSSVLESIPKAWRLDSIPSVDELPNDLKFVAEQLGPDEREITEMELPALISAVASGRLSARRVTEAYAHRAAVAHQLTNCLSEFMLQSALKEADRLDQHLAKTGKTVGPLHGIPVSLKDQFFVDGYETSVGFIAWLDGPASREDEAGIVPILRAAGAVFHVKTNVPTSTMCVETVNNVMGKTVNPYNRAYSPGGSSGGEGALLAQRGAPIGVGTDIGGSVRVPCSLTGLWGLKCSPHRLPPAGARTPIEGQISIPSVIGPMADSLDSLEFLTKLTLNARPWEVDSEVVEMPWRPYDVPEKLVFGIVLDDGVVLPQPPVRVAIEKLADKLRDAGHEVITFEPPSHAQALNIWLSTMTQTGGNKIHALCEETGEPLIQEVAEIMGASAGDREVMSAEEVWEMAAERIAYTAEYDKAWNATAEATQCRRPMDALLMPTTAAVGWKRGDFNYLGMFLANTGYTPVGNVLQYTGISMPVAKAEPIPKEHRDEFYNDMDEAIYNLCM
ncbi:amidase [Malassezia psittaci]|uniref:amidase n=1 Tax=Malassezia psittaci TaxID=1821823 RepID=A0AAF0JFJ4_9BASI|nr:amidase [Malassezia psittaci]